MNNTQLYFAIGVPALAVLVGIMVNTALALSLFNRVGSLESRVGSLDSRVSSVESRVGSLDNRLSSLETDLRKEFAALRLLMEQHHHELLTKISDPDRRLATLENERWVLRR